MFWQHWIAKLIPISFPDQYFICLDRPLKHNLEAYDYVFDQYQVIRPQWYIM